MKFLIFPLLISIASFSEFFVDPLSLVSIEDGSDSYPFKSLDPILSLTNMKDMIINLKNSISFDKLINFKEMDSLILRQINKNVILFIYLFTSFRGHLSPKQLIFKPGGILVAISIKYLEIYGIVLTTNNFSMSSYILSFVNVSEANLKVLRHKKCIYFNRMLKYMMYFQTAWLLFMFNLAILL